MRASKRDLEAAEERVEREREAAIARASAALHRPGSTICSHCGEPIDPKRRAALPSARTCIDCALEVKP
ncbi:TraR/DksA family transcriptional regulator [Sinorhizobium meliloti]|uniref:TraR/DksA C4-type zinc finger protein n=1 Tax=Rhizobium meliloti TaxID=382 RepID=UPI000FDADF2B|nr:TraR/DksA C4-type zinc finger protein [Sinorhizobium meliloti]RVG08824.1 TraR/DksA family transcriptional regulator [Sinorhizobium meliloti]